MATITGLTALAGLLSAAADGVSKVGDAIAHLVKLGAGGVDEVKARRARSRLIDIRSRLVNVRRVPNSRIYSSLEDFIHSAARVVGDGSDPNMKHRLASLWAEFTALLAGALLQVEDVFEDIRTERSDFVLESAYDEIAGSLMGRIEVIERLRALDPPSTAEDIEALKVVLDEYDRLRQSLGAASEALAEYLKAKP